MSEYRFARFERRPPPRAVRRQVLPPLPGAATLALLALIACGDAAGPPRGGCAGSAVSSGGSWFAAPIPCAAPGSSSVTIAGTFQRAFSGRAAAFEQGTSSTGLTVIDAYVVDEAGRPTAELFIFVRELVSFSAFSLVPVTLADLRSSGFRPAGAFAVYAESYDPAVRDYRRWLLGKMGIVRVDSVSSGRVGRVWLSLDMSGEWQDDAGTSLGPGTVRARVEAPLLRMRTPTAELRDSMSATLSGARTEVLASTVLDAFQVLATTQERLVVAGTVSAPDSTRELWLVLNGIPEPGDSIALGSPSLSEALAGRAAAPFAMLRVNTIDQNTLQPRIRQLWRSTNGYVKLTNVVQLGPLGLCGWASGRFAFDAVGVVPSSGTALGTLSARGSFETKLTVMQPADTLIESASAALLAGGAAMAVPRSSGQITCSS